MLSLEYPYEEQASFHLKISNMLGTGICLSLRYSTSLKLRCEYSKRASHSKPKDSNVSFPLYISNSRDDSFGFLSTLLLLQRTEKTAEWLHRSLENIFNSYLKWHSFCPHNSFSISGEDPALQKHFNCFIRHKQSVYVALNHCSGFI